MTGDFKSCYSSQNWLKYVQYHNPDTQFGIRNLAFQHYELKNPSGNYEEHSMLSLYELALLYYLAKDCYTGEGQIVDLGPLLGVNTNAFARGLDENTRVLNKEKRIYSFDLFLSAGMGNVVPENDITGSVFDRFLRNNRDYLDYISISPGDLLNFYWKGKDIEILFVDIAKSWELNNFVIQKFFTNLIPGKSLIIQQDYINFAEYWVAITMEYFEEYFEYVDSIFANSYLYILKKEIPKTMIDFNLQSLDLSEKVALLMKSIEKAPFSVGQVLKCGLAKCYIDHQEYEEALKVLSQVEIPKLEEKPFEAFSQLVQYNLRNVGKILKSRSGLNIGRVLQEDHFLASIKVSSNRITCQPGETIKVAVEIKNICKYSWRLSGEPIGIVNLGIHLLTSGGELVDYDYFRFPLNSGHKDFIDPNEVIELNLEMKAPKIIAAYLLEFDLVCEMMCWFKDNGSESVKIELTVGPSVKAALPENEESVKACLINQ